MILIRNDAKYFPARFEIVTCLYLPATKTEFLPRQTFLLREGRNYLLRRVFYNVENRAFRHFTLTKKVLKGVVQIINLFTFLSNY